VARVPETLRVMCIGSSSTYGAEAKTPYPLGLERLLEKDGRSVEVINAGVRGSVGNQLVRLLRDQLGQFEPDVVTVSLFYNDAYSLTQSDNEAYLQRVTATEGGRDRFIDAKFEREIANGAERYRTLSSAMDESAIAAAAADPDSPPARFERMLRRFIDLSRERDFRLVFIEEPVRGDEPHLWKKEFRAVMERLGREFGLPVVDPTPAMQQRGGAKLFVDPIHPNEQGHAIVAETLLKVIEHELDRRAGR
jgi:lysophospholipase L1-like esterase